MFKKVFVVMVLILGAQAQAATFELKAAVALAQPEAEETYGKVSFTAAEPYLGLDGAVAAWGIEFYAVDWKKPVSALAIAGKGQAEPTVKLWTGRPCHANPDMLAAAALAVHDQLGVRVSLPEKYYWLGERALWAAYSEKTAAGLAVYCNLVDQQAATTLTGAPAPRKTAAKLSFSLFGDGEVDYPSDSDIIWMRGQSYPVRWSDYDSSEVGIELYRGLSLKKFKETDNDGSTSWAVDKDFALGTNYRFKITASHNPFDFDWSDHEFEIRGSTAKVIYPSSSGITWKRGKKYTVRWSGFSDDEVRIELWRGDSLKAWKDTENDGSASWTVSKSLSKGSDYKIKILGTDRPWQYDGSDRSFKIGD